LLTLRTSFAALGLALGGRVFALCDREHETTSELSGVGESYGGNIADVKPPWTTMKSVNALPRLVPSRLHRDSKAALIVVPDHEGAGLWL